MKQRVRHASRRVLIAFTLSYFVLLLIPLAMGISAYAISVNLHQTQLEENNLLLLDSAIEKLTTSFQEIERFAQTVYGLDVYQKAMSVSTDSNATALYALSNLIQMLPTSIQSAGLVNCYYLYNPLTNVLITPGNAYLNLKKQYGYTLGYGDLPYERWHADVLNVKGNSVILPATEQIVCGASMRALTYVKTLPAIYGVRPRILFFLDEKRLFQIFAPIYESGASFIQIFDDAGQLLAALAPADALPATLPADSVKAGDSVARVDGAAYLVMRAESQSLNWRFAVYVNREVVAHQVRRMLLPILWGMGALLLIGALMTVLLMRHNRQPLERIAENVLPEGSASWRGLNDMAAAIRQLTSRHDELSQALDLKRLCLQNALIGQLINDHPHGGQSLSQLLAEAELPFAGRRYRGVYLQLPERPDASEVLPVLAPFEPQTRFLAFADTEHYALMYCAEDADNALSVLGTLHRALNARGHRNALYVGSPVSRLEDAPRSFADARHVMRDMPQAEQPIILAECVRSAGELNGLYSTQEEQRLLGLISAGRAEEAAALMGEIGARCVGNRPTGFSRQLLMHRLLFTLAACAPEENLPEALTRELEALDLNQFFALCAEHVTRLCARAKEQRNQTSKQLVERILAYIREHAYDSALCLSMVAQCFDLTENYLSAFIKEQSGVNFLAWLEQIRIQRADQLLDGSDLTVEQIAEAVGYVNVKTFRRVYIRVKGLRPTEYRRLHGQSEDAE